MALAHLPAGSAEEDFEAATDAEAAELALLLHFGRADDATPDRVEFNAGPAVDHDDDSAALNFYSTTSRIGAAAAAAPDIDPSEYDTF